MSDVDVEDCVSIKCPREHIVVWTEISKSRCLSDFIEVKVLGKGGYGCVVCAKNVIDDKLYALKKVSLDETIGFNQARKESVALSQVYHLNVVRYHCSWIENGPAGKMTTDSSDDESVDGDPGPMLVIQLELCHGTLKQPLKEQMEKEASVAEKAWDYFRQILEAVTYLESQNIRHGDISPANVFFADESRDTVKLGDFGLCSLMCEGTLEDGEEAPMTPYCPPEVKNNRNFHANSDVYSMGLILLEMLCGFTTEQERAQVFQSCKEHRLLPPKVELDDSARLLILGMTEPAPAQRMTTAEIRAALLP